MALDNVLELQGDLEAGPYQVLVKGRFWEIHCEFSKRSHMENKHLSRELI